MSEIDEAVERATKAIFKKAGQFSDETLDSVRADVRAVLTDAFPMLMNGKEWLAPMVADDDMLRKGAEELDKDVWRANDAWLAMRDAYLSRQQKDEGE